MGAKNVGGQTLFGTKFSITIGDCKYYLGQSHSTNLLKTDLYFCYIFLVTLPIIYVQNDTICIFLRVKRGGSLRLPGKSICFVLSIRSWNYWKTGNPKLV